MAPFQVGQMVRVIHDPSATTNLWDRVGKITFRSWPIRDITAINPGTSLERQYLVEFEDTGQAELLPESRLEEI